MSEESEKRASEKSETSVRGGSGDEEESERRIKKSARRASKAWMRRVSKERIRSE